MYVNEKLKWNTLYDEDKTWAIKTNQVLNYPAPYIYIWVCCTKVGLLPFSCHVIFLSTKATICLYAQMSMPKVRSIEMLTHLPPKRQVNISHYSLCLILPCTLFFLKTYQTLFYFIKVWIYTRLFKMKIMSCIHKIQSHKVTNSYIGNKLMYMKIMTSLGKE